MKKQLKQKPDPKRRAFLRGTAECRRRRRGQPARSDNSLHG